MKKFTILILMVLVLFSSVALAAETNPIELIEVIPSTISGYGGDVVNFSLRLTNTESQLVTSTFSSSDLVFGNQKISSNNIEFTNLDSCSKTIGMCFNFDSQATKVLKVSLTIPEDPVNGTYEGSITSRVNGVNRDFAYSVDVLNEEIIVEEKAILSGPESIVVHMEPGDDVEYEFLLANSGDLNLSNIQLSYIGSLVDSDEDKITLSMSPMTIPSLKVGASQVIKMTFEADSEFDIDEVSGSLFIYTSEGNTSIPVSLNVRPAACPYGKVGDLKIDVKDPSSSDEYEIGDTINVRVEIENKWSDDIDVEFEAFLWDIDDNEKIDSYKDSENIDDKDEYDFDFDLVIDEDFDQDNDLKIFVMAYDDDDDTKHCVEGSQSIDFNKVDDKVIIKSFTLNPMTAKAGDTVEAFVSVKNVGEDDQDVVLTIKDYKMGINVVHPTFTLDNKGSDASYVARVNFVIPEGVVAGNYYITADLDYADKSTHLDETLIVVEGTSDVVVDGGNSMTDSYVEWLNELQNSLEEKKVSDSMTGATVSYEEKDWLDDFVGGTVPTAVWVLVDIVLILGILALIVSIFKR